MKKLWIVALLSLFLVGCSLGGEETTETTVVVDTENFLPITTIDELMEIEMNKSYILMNDLDLTGVEWEPLGSFTQPFLGIFDGNNQTISNLTITDKNAGLNGLFAKVSGDISDLNLTGVSINYQTDFLTYAGALAGIIAGDVENVVVEALINVTNSLGSSHLGLLTGLSDCQISDISDVASFLPDTISGVDVSGEIIVETFEYAYVGGIVGTNFNYKITDNLVNVIASTSTDSKGTILYGGIVGSNYQGVRSGYHAERNLTEFLISNNIVISDFTVNAEEIDVTSGGIIGYNSYGILIDNFNASEQNISANNVKAGLLIGEDWHSDIRNSVTSGSITSTAKADEFVSVYKGLIYEEIGFENNYWHSETFESNMSTKINSLTEESFYVDNLNWETGFIQKITDNLS